MPSPAAKSAAAFGLLLLVGALVLWQLVPSRDTKHKDRDLERSLAVQEGGRGIALEEGRDPDGPATSRSELPQGTIEAAITDPSAWDALQALLAKLRELDGVQEDAGFYPEATKLVLELAQLLSTWPDQPAAVLDQALRDSTSSARLRGSLLLAFGLSGQARLDERARRAASDTAEDPASRVGALLGMGQVADEPKDAIYSVSEFFGAARPRRAHLFPLLLKRSESPPGTVGELLRIIDEADADLQVREVALLVAGQSIDSDRAVQQQCFAILTEEYAGLDSLLPAASFVLAHAKTPELVETLVELSASAKNTLATEGMLQVLARYGTSMAAAQALIRFGTDPSRSGFARSYLMLSLGKMLSRLIESGKPSEVADFIMNELALMAQNEFDPLLRLSALGAMTSAPDERALPVIESALFHDLDPSIRADAASIVQEATSDAGAAAALLTKAYHSEAELSVRIKILKALVKLGHEGSAPLFAMIAAGDPSEALVELAKTGLAKVESK